MTLFLVVLLLGIPRGAPVIHSLKMFETSSSEVSNLPEFVVFTLVDEVQIEYYDSNTRRFVPKQDWMNKITEEDPTYWERYTEALISNHQTAKANMEIAKQRFNHSGGLHLLQVNDGCEWDDETDEVKGFYHYAYDGEDLLSFDVKTETWIAPKPQGVMTKQKLDSNKARMAYDLYYYTKECPHWLKKFVNFGNSSLMRKELPSVSLLQKTPSSPVTCHATGFYPDRADLFWTKDDKELHEGVDKGEILPNHDGTFQMSVELNLSSVKAEDWGRFHCVFQLDGVPDNIVTTLDRRVIKTNWRRGFPPAAAAAAAAVLFPLASCITGLVLWRRNTNRDGFKQTNTSERSPSSGEDPAVNT